MACDRRKALQIAYSLYVDAYSAAINQLNGTFDLSLEEWNLAWTLADRARKKCGMCSWNSDSMRKSTGVGPSSHPNGVQRRKIGRRFEAC
jgi:hypothetical protein